MSGLWQALNTWQGMTVLACLAWGVWPIFLKQAGRAGGSLWGMTFALVCTELAILGCIAAARGTETFRWAWVRWAAAAGVAGVLSIFAFANALRLGKTGPVTGLSVIYPIVTVAIGWLVLKERVGVRELAGIVLCIAGAWLLTWQPAS